MRKYYNITILYWRTHVLWKQMSKARTRPYKTVVWVLKTEVLCAQGSHVHETNKKSCSRVLCEQGFLENCLPWADKTLAQDLGNLSHKTLAPDCFRFWSLTIRSDHVFCFRSCPSQKGIVFFQCPSPSRIESPYKVCTRLRTRPSTRLFCQEYWDLMFF